MERLRAESRETLRHDVRQRLRSALKLLLPGQKVVVFGSLTHAGAFNQHSDVDVALFEEPRDRSLFGLMAELEESVGRPVDVLLLDRCRFKNKILREGELWTNSD